MNMHVKYCETSFYFSFQNNYTRQLPSLKLLIKKWYTVQKRLGMPCFPSFRYISLWLRVRATKRQPVWSLNCWRVKTIIDFGCVFIPCSEYTHCEHTEPPPWLQSRGHPEFVLQTVNGHLSCCWMSSVLTCDKNLCVLTSSTITLHLHHSEPHCMMLSLLLSFWANILPLVLSTVLILHFSVLPCLSLTYSPQQFQVFILF